MKNQPKWGAKIAFVSFLASWSGALLALVFVLSVMDIVDFPFPSGLISLPVLETVMLAVTILFVRYKSVSLKELGLKRASPKILALASVAVVPLYLSAIVTALVLQIAFGPSPMAEAFVKTITPRDPLQLIVFILINLAMVAPIEELVFRGFIQKGFENSFEKSKGLLMASALFGLYHVAASPQNAVTAFVSGLVLGYVWQKTGENTTATAVTHGIYNTIQWILAYLIAV